MSIFDDCVYRLLTVTFIVERHAFDDPNRGLGRVNKLRDLLFRSDY